MCFMTKKIWFWCPQLPATWPFLCNFTSFLWAFSQRWFQCLEFGILFTKLHGPGRASLVGLGPMGKGPWWCYGILKVYPVIRGAGQKGRNFSFRKDQTPPGGCDSKPRRRLGVSLAAATVVMVSRSASPQQGSKSINQSSFPMSLPPCLEQEYLDPHLHRSTLSCDRHQTLDLLRSSLMMFKHGTFESQKKGEALWSKLSLELFKRASFKTFWQPKLMSPWPTWDLTIRYPRHILKFKDVQGLVISSCYFFWGGKA